MEAKAIHWCIHVLDRDASLRFYEEALGLTPNRVVGPEDGAWSNTYLSNGTSPFEIELTWNDGHTTPYENGGPDTHLAFEVEDFDAAHQLHEEMGVIIKENPAMGIYFISDPDGSKIEILPKK